MLRIVGTGLFACTGLIALALASGDAAAQGGPIKKIPAGRNVTLEMEGMHPLLTRRVVIDACVCNRDAMLEQLLTREGTKEHEAILAADIDARDVHLALLAAGAVAGKPVQYKPKLAAPTGTVIKITLEYKDMKGQLQRVPAQHWVRNIKTKKDLEHDWVFAGSLLIPDPLDKKKKPFYAANQGDVITVCNFEASMLDLPIVASSALEELLYNAHTERIPPLGTRVRMLLEPVPTKK